MVSGLGFQCTRKEGVSRCGLGAKGGKPQGEIEDAWWVGRQIDSQYGWDRVYEIGGAVV